MSEEYAINIYSLTKYYGKQLGIGELSLNVPKGCIYGFLGPNGAGKTTTIRMLLGFLKPTAGTARIAGYDILENSIQVRCVVGYLPGEVRLLGHLNGYAMIKFIAAMRRCNCTARAKELADILDLDLGQKIRFYSKGMRQKLGLILAMMHNPEILILDEPTTSLDPLVQQTVYELLKQYADNGGTVFFSSHIINEVERICERVAIIRNGRLVENAGIDELRTKSVQHIRVILNSESQLKEPLPDNLRLIEQDGSKVLFQASGRAKDWLDYLHNLDIEFIAIEPPSLEEVFMRFYQRSGKKNNA